MKDTKLQNPGLKKNARNMKRTFIVLMILSLCAVGMLVAGFIVPPTGVIDGSVLKACAILFGFAALIVVYHAIEKGVGASLEHGETKIQIKDMD